MKLPAGIYLFVILRGFCVLSVKQVSVFKQSVPKIQRSGFQCSKGSELIRKCFNTIANVDELKNYPLNPKTYFLQIYRKKATSPSVHLH